MILSCLCGSEQKCIFSEGYRFILSCLCGSEPLL